MKRVV